MLPATRPPSTRPQPRGVSMRQSQDLWPPGRSSACHRPAGAPQWEREHVHRADTCRVSVLMLTSGARSSATCSRGLAPGTAACKCVNHASPDGRTFLQAKQFAAKCAVNICSAQENDFNCVIRLVVSAASGQKRREKLGSQLSL